MKATVRFHIYFNTDGNKVIRVKLFSIDDITRKIFFNRKDFFGMALSSVNRKENLTKEFELKKLKRIIQFTDDEKVIKTTLVRRIDFKPHISSPL